MSQRNYVVKFNDTTDLYLLTYSPDYSQCTWTSADNPNVMTWDNLQDAEQVASLIGHGTVGTTKP